MEQLLDIWKKEELFFLKKTCSIIHEDALKLNARQKINGNRFDFGGGERLQVPCRLHIGQSI